MTTETIVTITAALYDTCREFVEPFGLELTMSTLDGIIQWICLTDVQSKVSVHFVLEEVTIEDYMFFVKDGICTLMEKPWATIKLGNNENVNIQTI